MSTQNTIYHLNNHLFEMLETLRDAETQEEINKEVARSKSMTDVAGKIIDNAKIMLEAKKYQDEFSGMTNVSRILIGDADNE